MNGNPPDRFQEPPFTSPTCRPPPALDPTGVICLPAHPSSSPLDLDVRYKVPATLDTSSSFANICPGQAVLSQPQRPHPLVSGLTSKANLPARCVPATSGAEKLCSRGCAPQRRAVGCRVHTQATIFWGAAGGEGCLPHATWRRKLSQMSATSLAVGPTLHFQRALHPEQDLAETMGSSGANYLPQSGLMEVLSSMLTLRTAAFKPHAGIHLAGGSSPDPDRPRSCNEPRDCPLAGVQCRPPHGSGLGWA
ncbi:hypothetical protein N657DRAFT_359506 [Parathielavia appendiculata]|uniref:Uncharacterized protein n=1 Tax=Parathielavia appendiculata TaxID=2587402 RepID=A0AAN6U2D5_9PEZI|nr:hypothetical protein N657DRAFT_359506 [Parathielavia appendiculata]